MAPVMISDRFAMSSKLNFFTVNARMSTVQTVKYCLELILSIYRFKKVAFLSENEVLQSFLIFSREQNLYFLGPTKTYIEWILIGQSAEDNQR